MNTTAKRRKSARYTVPIEGRFLPLTFDELDSAAYMSLPGNAAKVYGYLKRAARTAAHRGGAGERDTIFEYTYSEAKSKGFAEQTFRRALKELWAKGFIDLVERGGLRGIHRTNSQYKLARLWKSWGKGPGKWTDRTVAEPDPFTDTTEPTRANAAKW